MIARALVRAGGTGRTTGAAAALLLALVAGSPVGALPVAAPASPEAAASDAPSDPAVAAPAPDRGETAASPLIKPQPSPAATAIRAVLDEGLPATGAIEKAVAAGVRDFYAARGFEPAWIVAGGPTRQMTGLRRRMAASDSLGLDPADYETRDFAMSYPDAAAAAAADIAFSRAAARFATHVAAGRLDPASVSPIITLKPERPDLPAALARLSSTASIALAVSRLEPTAPDYRALKAELAQLDARRNDEAAIVVPAGASLKPGKADPRVPLLRERLGLAAPDEDPHLYDPALVDAVKQFQAAGGLNPDGIIGPRSLLALNGPDRADERAAVLANLERWRWMPRDLGAFHVFVNVPEYTVSIVRDGVEVHRTRVVVGAPDHRTPTFSSEISYLVVNPYWNVPTSIITKEMWPEIQRNPYAYFAKHNYQVLAQSGGKTRVIDPGYVDWWTVNPRSIRIRQLPGDANALGRIKFMFPNQHDVYLHDTPSKSLFKKDFRAFSHGCVRVDNPLEFADSLLAVAAPNWNSRRIEKLYGGPERRINLTTSVPVHLAYFTMGFGADGGLRRFPDVYGYDARMKVLLSPASGPMASLSP